MGSGGITTTHIVRGPGCQLEHQIPPESGVSVVYDASLRAHASLQRGLGETEAFTRSPGTFLVCPLESWSLEESSYTYATDAHVSLAEILEHQRNVSAPCGIAAALELMKGVAKALAEVSPAAKRAGLTSHGCLSPWRILIRNDGTPVLVGYGLPDTELFAYLDEQQPGVSIDTLRYAPPERLDDHEEDARSDLYTLAVIGAEMMLGRPVFDGSATSIAERVIGGDAPELIEAIGGHLGEAMLDLLCVATEHDRSERFSSIQEFNSQLRSLRGSGPQLKKLAAAVLSKRASTAPAAEPAPEPEPEPVVEEEPEPTSQLAARVPALPEDADLDTLRAHAKAVVARTVQLAEQASTMLGIAEQRASDLPSLKPLLRRLGDAVARAQKASTSTASTARLVDLDDEVDDARITLEMVHSAEKLCDSAASTALDILESVQTEVDEARAERDLIDRARRLAGEALERATKTTEVCQEVSRVTQATFGEVAPVIEGIRTLIASISDRTEQAASLTKRIASLKQVVHRYSRSVDALRDAEAARLAADEVDELGKSVQQFARQLDAARADSVEQLSTDLNSQLARAQSESLRAQQSLERAKQATQAASIKGLERAIKGIETSVSAAVRIAESTTTDISSLLTRPVAERSPSDLQRAFDAAKAAVDRVAEHARSATAASDALVARAGEAAARAAKLSKARDDSAALVARIEATSTAVDQTWDALAADTAEVTGRTARDAVQVAQRSTQKVTEAVAEALRFAAGHPHLDELPTLEAELLELIAKTEALEELGQRAQGRCREARGAASRELEEIAERHREQEDLKRAIQTAVDHAAACRKAVDEAWAFYRETVEALSAAAIDDFDDLRVRAYEIIDIAEYQAEEAQAAAESAKSETESTEARSHASTAASFEDRISTDLPEALSLLETARSSATAELEGLRTAKVRVEAAVDAAREAARGIEEMRNASKEAARDWMDDPLVSVAFGLVVDAAASITEAIGTTKEAEQRLQEAQNAASAAELVPEAEAAAEGLTHARTQCEAAFRKLEKAVKAARTETETRETAMRVVHEALDSVRKLDGQLAERSSRLFAAIDEHQATSKPVRESRKQMRLAIDGVGDAHDKIARAGRAVDGASTGAEASKIQQSVESWLEKVEKLLELAAESETQGVLAAEQEAVERIASEKRRLTQARSTALAHLNTAKQAAAKSVELLRDSGGELQNSDDSHVLQLHDEARAFVRKARTAATRALAAARKCQRAQTASDAMAFESEAASLAADAHAAVGEAKSCLQAAMDRSRKQEEAAAAVVGIQAEAKAMATKIEPLVDEATQNVAKVQSITKSSTDPITLATVTDAEAQHTIATRSAMKLRAAIPMVASAEALEVAGPLLDTCRTTFEKLETATQATADLVQQAGRCLSDEVERSAQRLAEARQAAARPAAEARTLVEKAKGWVETGERLTTGRLEAPVVEALTSLKARVAEVELLTEMAESAAEPALTAETQDEATEHAGAVKDAADLVFAAAETARVALDTVRTTLEEANKLDEAAQTIRVRAAEAAAAAELCATEAATIAQNLEAYITDNDVSDDEITMAFREVKKTAKAIATAATRAFEQTEATVGSATIEAVEAMAVSIDERKSEAEALLVKLGKQDRACRETVEGVRRRARDDNKRSKDEALRERLRQRRNKSTAMKREELKRQFQAERDEPARPNLDALRERLRSRRKPEPRANARPNSNAPRRMGGDRPRRRRPAPDDSSRLRAEGSLVDDPLMVTAEGASDRSDQQREVSRARRLQRRRDRQSLTGSRPIVGPEDDHRTEVGILSPDDLQDVSQGPPVAPEPPKPTKKKKNDPRDGADALLRRLRRGRRNDD